MEQTSSIFYEQRRLDDVDTTGGRAKGAQSSVEGVHSERKFLSSHLTVKGVANDHSEDSMSHDK